MAKQNAFLAKMEARYQAMSARKVNVALQMAKDVADMAAAEVFQMGEGRAETWTKVYSEILTEMMEKEEIEWFNAYQQMVCDKLSPHLDEEHREWLKEITRPITMD